MEIPKLRTTSFGTRFLPETSRGAGAVVGRAGADPATSAYRYVILTRPQLLARVGVGQLGPVIVVWPGPVVLGAQVTPLSRLSSKKTSKKLSTLKFPPPRSWTLVCPSEASVGLSR